MEVYERYPEVYHGTRRTYSDLKPQTHRVVLFMVHRVEFYTLWTAMLLKRLEILLDFSSLHSLLNRAA